MLRKLALLLALALAASGCNCGGNSAPDRGVSFVAPTDGASLTMKQDVANDRDGLQIGVSIHSWGWGSDSSATLVLDADSASPLTATLDADGNATFAAVTLGTGSHVLTAKVSNGKDSSEASISLVADATPLPASIAITAPADGTLNASKDLDPNQAELQIDVAVQTTNLSGGKLRLCLKAEGLTGTACAAAPGVIIAEEPMPTANLTTLRATLPQGVGELLSAEHVDANGQALASLPVTLTVDTVAPTLAFKSPKDGDREGKSPFQVVVTTDAEAGQTVTLSSGTMAQLFTAEVDSAGEATFAAVQSPGDGPLELRAEVADKAGNPAKAAVATVQMDTTPCPLTLVSPASATVIWGASADLDQNPANGLQVDLAVTTQDLATKLAGECKGQPAKLYVNGIFKADSTSSDPTTGEIKFASVTFADGEKDLPVEIRLTDVMGLDGKADFTATVMLKAPTLSLFTDSGTRNLVNDVDYLTPGIQTLAIVGASAAQGGNIWICSTVAHATGAAACPVGTGFIAAGPQAAQAGNNIFTEVTLAEGAQKLSAVIRDSADNTGVSGTVDLLVDSVAPSVTAFSILEDSNGDHYLNATELPASASATLQLTVTGADGQILAIYENDGAGPMLASHPVAAGAVTLTTPLADGVHTLLAKVTSAHGNPNVSASPVIANDLAHLTVTVKRIAPQLAFAYPSRAMLNRSDDKDLTTPDILDNSVRVASDASSVDIAIDSGAPQAAAVVAGEAQLAIHLSQGAHTVSATAKDIAANVSTKSFSFTVDTIPPTVTFNSPAANAQFSGYSVPLDLAVVGAEVGQVLAVTTSAGGASVGSKALDATGQAKFSVLLGNGQQTLTAKVSDLAGNEGSASVQITVASVGCKLVLVQPAVLPARYGIADDLDKNPSNGLQVNLVAKTTDCMGRNAELFVNGVSRAVVAADASGFITFSNVTFADGVRSLPVHIDMVDAANQTASLPFDVSVKLTAPAFTVASPAVPANGATLYLVAAGNPKINGTTYLQDAVAGNATGDASFSFTVSDALGGILTAKIGTTDLLGGPVAITKTPENFGAPFALAFAQNTQGTMVVTADDGFGNKTSLSYPLMVDVIPPAAPTLNLTLKDAQRALVTVGFTGTGDDGVTGSTSSYDVRYLTSTQAGATSGCPILDLPAFNTKATAVTGPAGGPAGQQVSFDVGPLPPLNCYGIGVRAVDKVGNVSDFTNAATLRNYWNQKTVSNTLSNTMYAFAMVSGDLDKNGADDLVVPAPLEGNGAVHIYYGATAGPAATAQTITGTGAGEALGYGIAVGDLNGDKIDDLVVAAPMFTSGTASLGRVLIFFGTAGGQIDPASYIEIRGRNSGGFFGFWLNVVGDIDGDGYKDLLVGANYDGADGHAFLFRGKSTAGWQAARTATDSSTTPATKYISAASADMIFAAPNAGDALGARDGFTDLGDLDGDGKHEFTIPASTSNRLYLFNAANTLAKASPVSTADLTLTPPTAGTLGLEGFGAMALGGTDFTGDGVPDLLVAAPSQNAVYFYPANTSKWFASSPAQSLVHLPGSFFGSTMASRDFDGDGKPDLLVGNNASSPTNAEASTFWLYLNNGTSTPLPASANAIVRAGALSSVICAGDFNGDKKPDFAVADQNGAGSITIYYP